jgi:hypothetical protein
VLQQRDLHRCVFFSIYPASLLATEAKNPSLLLYIKKKSYHIN